jgi:lysophospholipase L1-like esterase
MRVAAAMLVPLVLTACATETEPLRPFRHLALGDSYTIGEGVDPEERWPAQLASRLRAEGFAMEDPEIVARTGWTTAELDAAIDAAAPQGPYDLVSLLIGVNDQFRGLDIGEYRAGFVTLLERAIGFAGGDPGRVMVFSIPDWGVTPFAADHDAEEIAAEIDAFNAAASGETMRRGARYIDVTPISRRAGGDPTLLAGDGLHPSGAVYAEWAGLALPLARQILDR